MYLLDHLKHVSMKCDSNKMNTANLAICFGPALLCPCPKTCSKIGQTMDFKKHIEVLKYLLDIWPEYRGTSQVCRSLSTFSFYYEFMVRILIHTSSALEFR